MVNKKKVVDPRVMILLQEFGSEVRVVMTLKGVTLRWLEDTARAKRVVPLPKASVSRMINGVNEPNWAMVEQILRLCDVSEDEINGVWKPRWRALLGKIRAVGVVANIGSAESAPRECSVCGAAVLNQERHDQWHAEADAQARRQGFRTVS